MASWREAYRGIVPQAHLDGLNAESRAMRIQEMLGWPEARGRSHWVLEANGLPIGFADTEPSRDADADPERVAELCAIYLHPDGWGRGGGKLLLDHALKALAAAGFSEAILWVLADNARACRFYESSGFVRDGSVRAYTFAGQPSTGVRYRLTLK